MADRTPAPVTSELRTRRITTSAQATALLGAILGAIDVVFGECDR